MRRAFSRWGTPRRIRVDNGRPWGSITGDFPSELALWLAGLGVEVVRNPPRRPQDNGVVERSQGTGKRWAEPASCRDAAELQRRIDEEDRVQRESYPAVGGRSRLEAFPDLALPARPYREEDEPSAWDLAKSLEHLAGWGAIRRADADGKISLYNRSRFVGRAAAGRDVYVSLDPVDREWVYADARGMAYRRQPADELTAGRIRSLAVSHRRERDRAAPRPNPPSQSPAQPPVA